MGLHSHYDGAHNHPANRALHMIAIPIGFSSLIVVWISLDHRSAADSGHVCAGLDIGHWIEGNKLASLTNPAHVFVAPVWMTRKIFGIDAKKQS